MQSAHYTSTGAGFEKKNARPKKKSKVVKPKPEDLTPEEREERNQRYLDVLRDLKRLRAHFYNIYIEKLDAKVRKQRKELAARDTKLREKLLRKQETQEKLAHSFAQRLPKHTLTSDTAYLEKIPKSRYYHLVAVEDLMKTRGILKHKEEFDTFWEKAKSDPGLWKRPLPTSIPSETLTERMLSRYSSLTMNSTVKITVGSEASPRIDLPPPPPGILKKISNYGKDGDAPGQAEKRCESPPLVFAEQPKYPKLHTFNSSMKLKLKSEVPGSLQVNAEPSGEPTSSQANLFHHRRSLQHRMRRNAFEVAVVNAAMTERLMQRQTDTAVAIPSYSIHDTLQSQQQGKKKKRSLLTRGAPDVAMEMVDTSAAVNISIPVVSPPPPSTSGELKVSVGKGTTPKTTQRRTPVSSPPPPTAPAVISPRTAASSCRSSDDVSIPSSNAIQPLSIDMMLQGHNVCVKEVNPTRLWVNYANLVDQKANSS